MISPSNRRFAQWPALNYGDVPLLLSNILPCYLGYALTLSEVGRQIIIQNGYTDTESLMAAAIVRRRIPSQQE